MIPFDPFMGMLSMQSGGTILDPGTHIRIVYSLYAGYPRHGHTLFRLSADNLESNVLQEIPLYRLPGTSPLRHHIDGPGIERPQTVHIFSRSSDGDERGMLLCGWQSLDLRLVPEVGAFQMVLFGLGYPVSINITTRGGESHDFVLDLLAEEMQPFYFEAIDSIQDLIVTSSAALVLELQFFAVGWREAGAEPIARLNLPASQAEIDDRIQPLGVGSGRVRYEDFVWIADKMANPLADRPPREQFFMVDEEALPGESSEAAARLNPHELLNTMSIKSAVARAAGLYYVDKDPSQQDSYLLGGHWTDEELPDGYVWLPSLDVPFRDTDPFPAPEMLRATAVAGHLQNEQLVAAPSGTAASGIVGVGLRWRRPLRTVGVIQNHAVSYLIRRTEVDSGEVYERDLLTGYVVHQGRRIDPEYQLVDFGEDSNGLDGIYQYEVRGVDLFGRVSEPAHTAPVSVDSFTIPPAPMDVQARLTDLELEVSFSWTAREYAKDPAVRQFKLYLDERQLSPVKGRITAIFARGRHTVLHIAPDDPRWDDGVELRGGAVQMMGNICEIQDVLSREPLQLLVPQISETIPANTPCTVTANWRSPATWRGSRATRDFDPSPETGEISGVIHMPGYPSERVIALTGQPFAGVPNVAAATVFQDGREFTARTVAGEPTRLRVEAFRDEDGTATWPVPGPVLVYPRVTLLIREFEVTDIVPGSALRKRFALGVTATDDPSDGSNEGPVSPRVIVHWMSAEPPATWTGTPEMTSVPAERADADGCSTYRLKWEPFSGAMAYHVYRASEEMVVGIDRQRSGRSADYYTTLNLSQLWQLANDRDNARAFDRLTVEPWTPVFDTEGKATYTDRTLPGHSNSRFFYRVQGLSETRVAGALSDVFQPVHCPPARPPEKLGISRIRVAGSNVILYWPHIMHPGLDYYVVYRTEDEDVARAKLWRRFGYGIKVRPNEAARPLAVEYGLVDISNLAGGRDGTPLGIFRYTEYEARFGDAAVDFAIAAAALTNRYAGEVTLGRAWVSDLDNHEAVVCYYRDGSTERFVKKLAGEKMLVDTVPDPGTYFYCVAAVDDTANLSELSVPVKVEVE
jgi:hypothetical protein